LLSKTPFALLQLEPVLTAATLGAMRALFRRLVHVRVAGRSLFKRATVAFVFILICRLTPLAAPSPEYISRRFQTDAGLPENTINALAQTPDGYIWCATFSGLARFDGVRFEIFDPGNTPEMPTDRITQLAVSRTGALVMVSEFRDVVLFENGRFKRCKNQKSWSNTFADDDAGQVWMLERSQNSDSWVCLSDESAPLQGKRRSIMRSISVGVDANGNVYAGNEFGFSISAGGTREEITPKGLSEPVGRFYSQKSGMAWVVGGNALQLFDGREIRRSLTRPSPEAFISDVLEDERGQLWVTYDDGRLFEFDLTDGSFREVRRAVTSDGGIKTLLVDREGNILLGMYNHGLEILRKKAMRTIGVEQGLLSPIVRSISEDAQGGLWVCTPNGINIVANDQAREFKWNPQLELPWTTAPTGGADMWLGLWASRMYRIDPENCQLTWQSDRGSWEANAGFTFLFLDSKKLLWFGNSSGLFNFDGTNATMVRLPTDKPVDVRTACEGKNGELYVGANGGGMFVRQSGIWKHFGRAEGLDSEQVYSLHVDAAGIVWIGMSGGGLARFDGQQIVSLNRILSELPRSVSGIQSDDLGFLWLASARGVFRVKLEELNAAADGENESATIFEYSLTAGMPTAACTAGIQPSVVKARDGRIWFATREGLVCFDPKNIPFNALAPPVVIETVTSTKSRIDLTRAPRNSKEFDSQCLKLSSSVVRKISALPGANPIEFSFTGLSFAAPENVHFRYRMEPLEKTWTKTSERKASYQRLPPGDYTFRVSACNNDGVWNEQGAALAIVQLPYFWETAWFKISVAAAFLLAVYGAYRYRLSQLKNVGKLRARIAADLHDEVGSNMGAIILNSDLLKSSARLSASDQEQISDILRVAQNTAQAVREIAWFINPDFDYLDQMIVRMKEVASRLSKTHEVSFTAPEQAPKIALSLEFRRNVMAIYKEVLNNASRHAHASRLTISITINTGQLVVEIQDDGCGFDLSQDRNGHGLRNARNRIEELKGLFEVASQPGTGTTVKFRVKFE
jgi:signal transduction histidine kinase/ligand-binding sensor domain-containing protein